MFRMVTKALCVTLFAAAAAVIPAGCNSPVDPSDSTRFVRVVGQLTAEGVECPAMRGDDGKLYTLSPRDVRDAKVGDRVRVTGRVAEASICMQGTTLIVDSLEVLH